ncbi:sigma-E factor negative regulatory protein [Chitinibacter tainanensis]|uniref:sigma-E factor negative regulatory protein n=1 Tax=Chitinibacter tainanensis TaxID=230667 RepID=UPI000420D8C9|nr:sigma-E factor negative regulatory protein [Chitinibacter tainanensis]
MNEKLSALLDNELDPAEWAAVLDAVKQDPQLQQQWQEWYIVRDALSGHVPLSGDFMQRFSARLSAEPVVIAPQRLTAPKGKRWLVPMATAASVAFVGLAVWQFSFRPAAQPLPQMASVSVPAHAQVNAAEVRAYLAAHRNGVADPLGGDHLTTVSFEVGEQR